MPSYDECAIYVAPERNPVDMLYGQGKNRSASTSNTDINENA
jgi:hypothetical protein